MRKQMIGNTIIKEKITSINHADKKISLVIMSSFVILPIQYLILIYFNLLESITGSNIQMLSKILVGIVFIYALPAVLRRSKIKFIVVYYIAIFVFILHYAIFPENRKYIIDLLFPFFFMCLPAFVYTLSIRDLSILTEIMRKTSFIIFVAGLIVGTLVFSGKSSVGAYSMSLSYYMLLPAIVFLDELFEKFCLKKLIFFILLMIIILSLGSRGPVVCIFVFSFLKLFSPHSKKTYKKAIIRFGLIGIAIIALVLLDKTFEFLYNLLLGFGINSRTLRLFSSDRIFYLSGREEIYESLIGEIYRKPIIGVGIAGDRRIINSYSHNLFIELISDFGIIIGLIIIIGIILLIVRSLSIKNKEKYSLITMWFSLGFVPLMVSGSYLTDMKFWIFFGLLLKYHEGMILYNNIDKKPSIKELKTTGKHRM